VAEKKGKSVELLKKQVGSEAIYPEIPCWKKRMMRFPGHHKCPRILHCFLRRKNDRLIVAPEYDDLRKSTRSLKRGGFPSPLRAIDGARVILPLYFGQVRFMNGIAVFTIWDLRLVPVSRTGRDASG
jgi:hypothetical protein